MFRCISGFVVIFVVFSSVASASEWTGANTIEWIRAYPNESGTHFLKIADVSFYDGCASTLSSGVIRIDDLGGRVYGAALAALLSGKTVRFWLDGCDGSGRAKVKEIQIERV